MRQHQGQRLRPQRVVRNRRSLGLGWLGARLLFYSEGSTNFDWAAIAAIWVPGWALGRVGMAEGNWAAIAGVGGAGRLCPGAGGLSGAGVAAGRGSGVATGAGDVV